MGYDFFIYIIYIEITQTTDKWLEIVVCKEREIGGIRGEVNLRPRKKRNSDGGVHFVLKIKKNLKFTWGIVENYI